MVQTRSRTPSKVDAAEEEKALGSPEKKEETPTPKRGRGRPRKTPTQQTETPKRGRGRPRKTPAKDEEEAVTNEQKDETQETDAPASLGAKETPKRGRGRPRKTPVKSLKEPAVDKEGENTSKGTETLEEVNEAPKDVQDNKTPEKNLEQVADGNNEPNEIVKVSTKKNENKAKRTTLSNTTKKAKARNELTKLIPGYTAPLKLQSSSLDMYRQPAKSTALAPPSYGTGTVASFKTGKRRKPAVDDAGAGWFGMRGVAMTDEIKKDINLIRNRNYLDPKRFYKSSDATGQFVQQGTVIEGAAEFYSSRLTKKQRKSTLVQEVMADPSVATYAQEKFKKMARAKNSAAEKRAANQRKFTKKARR